MDKEVLHKAFKLAAMKHQREKEASRMNLYTEILQEIFRDHESEAEERRQEHNIQNYSYLCEEYDLIQQKKSKLSSMKRKEIVARYEETHKIVEGKS